MLDEIIDYMLVIGLIFGGIALWRIIYCLLMSRKYNIRYIDGDPRYSHLKLFTKNPPIK